MSIRDWALVTYTILAQMSVGSFLVLGIVHFFAARRSGLEEADRLSDRALLAIGPVLILSLVASLFHLGNPLNAFRAVTQLGTSWLSAEIFFSVLFTLAGGLFAWLQWRKIATPTLRNIIAWIAAVIGLALVFCMSNVYQVRTVPVWNTLATPISFYTTTFLLGSMAMGAAFVANYAYVQRKNPGCADVQCVLLRDALRWIALAAIVFLGAEFVILPMYLAYLASSSATVVAAAGMAGPYNVVFMIRLALVFIGAGLLAVFVYRNATSVGREKIMGNLTYLAFASVLIGEALGRYLFYASYMRIGV